MHFIFEKNWILTAGHCAQSNFTLAGFGNDHDLVKIYNEGRIYAKRLILHPDYKLDDKRIPLNDIALIELAHPVEFNDVVSPACLDNNPSRNYGDNLIITGYGQSNLH